MPREIIENVLRRSDKKDERSFDREFWKNAGPEAIFSAAWEMTAEVPLIRGQKEHRAEPRISWIWRD
ncbi:MAG: hypothetical protein WCP55_03955 [Lentisphaerota bacterium]